MRLTYYLSALFSLQLLPGNLLAHGLGIEPPKPIKAIRPARQYHDAIAKSYKFPRDDDNSTAYLKVVISYNYPLQPAENAALNLFEATGGESYCAMHSKQHILKFLDPAQVDALGKKNFTLPLVRKIATAGRRIDFPDQQCTYQNRGDGPGRIACPDREIACVDDDMQTYIYPCGTDGETRLRLYSCRIG